jgi:hypothetical protein
MNMANMAPLTALLFGQTGANKGANNAAGLPQSNPPEQTSTSPDFRKEVEKLVPMSGRADIKRRLRTGEPIEGLYRELSPRFPGLKVDHIKALGGEAFGTPKPVAAPEPAPAPAPAPKKTDIGDYFLASVVGSSSANLVNPVVPYNPSGSRPAGNTGNPRASVRSTRMFGSVQDAAASLEQQYLNGQRPKPEGYPSAGTQQDRIAWIVNEGSSQVNSNPSSGFVINNGQFVPRKKAAAVQQVVPANAPKSTVTGNLLPRALPQLDTNRLRLDLYDPTRSANLLSTFTPIIAGAKATNKSMGEQLKIVQGMGSSGRDLGIWGTLGQAYVDNANNAPAQELVVSIAKGIQRIATANQTAVQRGWTVAQTKPLIEGWTESVNGAFDRLKDGNTADIAAYTRKLNKSFVDNKALSAFIGGVDNKAFGEGTHISDATKLPLVSVQNIAPIILSDAGKVIRNQLAKEFLNSSKTVGAVGYNEAAQAAANFIDAVINNPDTPIAKQLTAQIENALKVNDAGTLKPQDINNIATYVAMRRSNKAGSAGPVVNQYIANIINRLNLPKQLLAGLSTSWKNDSAFTYETGPNGKKVKTWRKVTDDLNASAEILRNKGGTDWTRLHQTSSPWLNESVLGNVFPTSWNDITKNVSNDLTKRRLESGTQYTPERGKQDLLVSGLKQSLLSNASFKIKDDQFNFGVFAPFDSPEADKIANLGQAGVEWVRGLSDSTYQSLIERAFTPASMAGKKAIKPKMLGLSTSTSPQYVSNKTNITPTIANRLIHAIMYPQNNVTATDTNAFIDQLREDGKLSKVGQQGKDQPAVQTIIPAQAQRVGVKSAKPAGAELFTDEDFDKLLTSWTNLNYKFKGGDSTALKMRQAANYQLQSLTKKLKDSIGVQQVAARGVGVANKGTDTGNESLATVRRLLNASGDSMSGDANAQKQFGEFKTFVDGIVGESTGTKRRNVKEILQMLNSLPEREKADALSSLDPNKNVRNVSLNPLGLTKQEMRDFGIQLDALIKRSPKAPQLIDLSGTLGPGVRILRRLSGDDGLKALQIINDISGLVETGVPLPGPRPASMGAYNDPTARAALRTIAGESKAVRSDVARISAKDPIEGAGLQLQRGLITNDKLAEDVKNEELTNPRLARAREKRAGRPTIGEVGPTGKGFRNLLGIGGLGAFTAESQLRQQRTGGR